jgi:PAS domain S-box-containing protein
MLTQIKLALAPPVFEDEDKTRVAGLLNIILLATIAANVAYNPVLAVILPNPTPSLVIDSIFLLLQIGVLVLLRRGYVQVASISLLFLVWIYITFVLYSFGGVRSPLLNGYIVLVLIASLLLRGWGAIGFAGLSVVSSLAILLVELSGILPASFVELTPAYVWSGLFMVLIVMAVLLYLATRSIDDALERTRRSEAHAREAQDQLVDAIESLTEAFLLYDADDRLVLCNSKAREFYDLSADLLVPGVRFEDHIRASAYRGQIAPVIGREETWVQERVAQHQHVQEVYLQQLGNGRWLQISERKTGAGGIVSVRTDVTERVRAEAALQESEEKYRSLVEVAQDPIFTTDPDGRYLYVNSAAAARFGTTPEQIVGKSVNDLFPDRLAERYRAAARRVIQTGEGMISEELSEINGQPFWFSTNMQPICDRHGQVKAVQAVVRDISSLKQAEQALHKSEERLRQVVRVSYIGIFDHDHLTDIIYWSRQQRTIYGWGPDEPVTLPAFLECVYPEDRERIGVAVGRAHDPAGDGLFDVEHRIIRRDGAIRWLTTRSQTFFDGEGDARHAVRTVGAVQDITERKQLEAQFRQSQKMEAIGQLAGGIAHDFNNILTAIMGYSELLLQLHPDERDPERKDIEQIKQAGERATSLTRQLLAFSRQQILQPQVLNLNGVVADMSKMLRRLIGEDIDLVTLLDEELGRVKADPGQIERVILNLAVNARDAMPRGGKLTIETVNVDLDEEYARRYVEVEPGPYVMLAVSDTGVGMDAETRSRLFEPFYTTKEQGKGTGLGLATVHGIINQSGGRIWVYSEPDQGTTFKMYLPRTEEAVELVDQDHASARSLQGSETILLVEDEDMVRELARHVLTQHGYIVLAARHGEEALQFGERHAEPIHLLLTDVIMPRGMSGRQLAERLASLRPEIRVLYMSGYTDDAIVHHGVLESGTNFLQKPFATDALAAKVRRVLDTPPAK